ncbi:HAUS augmin-like complex subunit 6 N-terminus-domain-containing protein [Nemania sp. NC0429]|nr:HAUS augmin-like complex subunit 6 N-terminus-domain-containing protein [Nemania sp. NC0429]
MSSYQSNPALARTRSLRAPAKPTLTAPPTLTSAINTNKSPQIPTCGSNVLLFLTNSRLLDLDLEPDWPDITPTTFSAKDAAGGQKKRIQCVEWALYQLFSLWDHNDAQSKLRPFFPPADQVQSINLRAALVRSLEAAKKNGVLGRDVLIRKTMLDECKGERLEEVLAVFSSAVLKKLVAERALNSGPAYRPTISEGIALENWGYTGDRTELNGLLLAHKVSLRSILEKKRAAREKYRSFKELLDMKERGVARRREQAKSDSRDGSTAVSDTTKAEVRRILRNNWAGNEQWVDGLLGDSSRQKGGLLNTPFDDVWSGLQAGNVTDLEERTTDLLEQLEQRVLHQKSRLQKWEDFRKNTFGGVRPRIAQISPAKENKAEIGFDFTAHLTINFNDVTRSGSRYMKFDKQPPEYARLLAGLATELEGLKRRKIPDFSNLVPSTRRASINTTSSQFIAQEPVLDPVSDLSEWEEEPEEAIPPPKTKDLPANSSVYQTAIPRGFTASRKTAPRDDRKISPVYREIPSRLPKDHKQFKAEPQPVQVDHKPTTPEDDEIKPPSRYEESRVSHGHQDEPQPATRMGDFLRPPPRSTSPTQVLADEILNSMNNASPSPMKKSRYTLTLAERTRMSMTHTTSFEPEDETLQLSPVKGSFTQRNSNDTPDDDPERGEEYEDLITRTRRSMAGFEAVRQKAQLERRRSQKKSKIAQRKDSYFPKVDEETVGDVSVVEELIEDGQEDYEAVFKSRPRIATSPVPGPYRQ